MDEARHLSWEKGMHGISISLSLCSVEKLKTAAPFFTQVGQLAVSERKSVEEGISKALFTKGSWNMGSPCPQVLLFIYWKVA